MSSLSRCYNIEDLHDAARRRLPRGVYDFVARGTEDGVALDENRKALERIKRLRATGKTAEADAARAALLELYRGDPAAEDDSVCELTPIEPLTTTP